MSQSGVVKSDAAIITQFSQTREELDHHIQQANKVKRDSIKKGADPNAAAGGGVNKKDDIHITEHLMSGEDAINHHGTNLETGLNESQVQEKFSVYGPNCLRPPPSTPLIIVFLHHLTGFFSILLWAAGILCFIAYGLNPELGDENLILGIVLVVVVILTGVFSFYQDFKAVAAMEGFKNFLPPESIVLREGQELKIPAKDLVPGDIIQVKSGDKIPADIRIITFSNFKVDNSSLTGEPEALARKADNTQENPLEATNLAFYGTLCVSGNCTGLVISTGDNTVIGTIAILASSTTNTKTPIAQEIEHFIWIISAIAIFLAVTFLIICIAKQLDGITSVVFVIGILVANVPEGLLATVTVSLTLTAKRMAVKKVLVKNLESVETLGSTTVIASDKTGTLTQNRMTAAHCLYNLENQLAHGEGKGSFDVNDPTFKKMHMVACLCNNATFIADTENMSKPVLQRDTNGDASESAFIKFCEPLYPIMKMRGENKKISEVPFNSANKYQVSIHLQGNDPEKPRLLAMKGAPERVFTRCKYMLVDGEKVEITDEIVKKYEALMRVLMQGGERVLGTAMIELDPKVYNSDYEYITDDPDKYNFPLNKEDGLIFCGCISLIDPPRAAVPGAVLNCQKAGIKVIMVTGDHPDTAEAIAKQVHIIRDKTRRDLMMDRGLASMDDVDPNDDAIKAIVVTGTQLGEMSDEELSSVLEYDQIVFARTSPKQKLVIVQGLQNKRWVQRGYPVGNPAPVRHVVAVTGDGVNDSPALKAADIGVAMGIAGSDVAKEAADMILLNDNFASIVDGVEEGRLIFDNLKKSIAYTLSSNIPEISPFLVYIIAGIPSPLPTVLILLIDLGTDMVPAISLAYEDKESNIMQKPPRDMNSDRLVTGKLVNFSYVQIGVIQALAGFYTYFAVLNDYGFPPYIMPGMSDCWEYMLKADIKEPGSWATDNGGACWIDSSSNPPVLNYPLKGVSYELGPCNIATEYYGEQVCYTPGALAFAQTAYFISIIVVQWADLLCCKTRSLSLKHQGMRNGTLIFGLCFETALGVLFCYCLPVNAVGTRPLEFVHFVLGLPFMMVILTYDEVRKFFLRNLGKNNWFERNTYY